jgi:peptidoglycan/LPS O-acetylase OafA/YrhL
MTVKYYGYNWANFTFSANLCFFSLGVYSYRLACQISNASMLIRWYIPALSIVLIGALMLAAPDLAWKGDPFLWGVGLAALCLWQSVCPSRWCANKFFEYVGERSYSVYLLHPIIIVLLKNPIRDLYEFLTPHIGSHAYFLCALLVFFPLVLLSEITYRVIEIPGIRFGQNLNNKLRARAATEARLLQKNLSALTKYSV